MSRKRRLPKPPSLAQHFEAPDDCYGFFGWVCGYSADAAFLNDALERFTRQTSAQRANEGKVWLAGMLDPTNPWISPVDAPGFAHLRIKNVDKRPFRLLHAKVALLGFRAKDDAEQWKIRLIVSTGNWTRSTMEESLDLAWRVELGRQDLGVNSDEVRAVRTDINAAWSMLRWLREHFDTDILSATPAQRLDTTTSDAYKRFEQLAASVRSANNTPSRFFHNRKKSLLEQLPAKLKAMQIGVRRNYVAMGSGFFQTPTDGESIPSVLTRIVGKLQDESVLTQNPGIDVFVNDRNWQAVANALPAFADKGWTVRKAYKHEDIFGEGTARDLHAKFILSGNEKQSNNCTSPWLYIGSGNLTEPGFLNASSRHAGNLEAGVIFGTNDLYWRPARNLPSDRVIPNILPVRWDDADILTVEHKPEPGPPFEQRKVVCVAPPVSYLFWRGTNETGVLSAPEDAKSSIAVLDGVGKECDRDPNGNYIWPGKCPNQVVVCWQTEDSQKNCAPVPVLDESGRISGTPLQPIEVDDAWRQLENFPMVPDDVDDEYVQDGEMLSAGMDTIATPTSTVGARYPIRTMMELIEKIAAQQTGVSKSDWTAWCHRFEQTLIQAADSHALNEFKELKLNPLSPLRHAPFRPTFAETADSAEGKRYEDALSRVEDAWGVADMAAIGGVNHGQ